MLIKLRLAKPQDADALLEIYAPYVKQTAISFEYDVPGVAEFAGRIEQTLQRYPYLIAYVSDEATPTLRLSKSARHTIGRRRALFMYRKTRAQGSKHRKHERLHRLQG